PVQSNVDLYPIIITSLCHYFIGIGQISKGTTSEELNKQIFRYRMDSVYIKLDTRFSPRCRQREHSIYGMMKGYELCMIGVYDELMDGIPVLMVVDKSKTDRALPVVTYFHGFTSAKEHNLPFAYLMAHEGYRVVMPDSLFHGDREENI